MKFGLSIAIALFSLLVITCTHAQGYDLLAEKRYEKTYDQLEAMLKGRKPTDFKQAVLATEKAYFGEAMNEKAVEEEIAFLADLVHLMSMQIQLKYEEQDSAHMKRHAALFRLMTDTLHIESGNQERYEHMPYTYDFSDIWGTQEWSNMFVSKLLQTHKGNCHSLPFLYKIIAEEMGEKAWIAAAPNHFYIKYKSKKYGWYNTELTSAQFPIDAWLMASGYIHLSAIQNSMYMDTLSEKELIAVCMIDLAQGYEKKFGIRDGSFILMCCDEALKHYPQYAGGLLFQVETKRKLFFRMMDQAGASYPSEIFHLKEAKTLFDEMETMYAHIHKLGYRRMPESMYLDWLTSLKTEQAKYQNQKIQRLNAETP